MMLYIQECSIDLKNELPIKDFEIFYELKDDNKTIGFSAFRNSNENPIYIFIKKEMSFLLTKDFMYKLIHKK